MAAWLPIVLGAAAAGNAIMGSRRQGQANDLQREALDIARQDYADRAPLRQAFTQGAMTPIATAPDLGPTLLDQTNPFASYSGPNPHVSSQLNLSGIDVSGVGRQAQRREGSRLFGRTWDEWINDIFNRREGDPIGLPATDEQRRGTLRMQTGESGAGSGFTGTTDLRINPDTLLPRGEGPTVIPPGIPGTIPTAGADVPPEILTALQSIRRRRTSGAV